jgi:3-hydroxyacyl-[acyl-carrier-protein] dehydratase
MRFRQIDKISKLVPGERIEAQKTLTGKEDYLRDHFPRFAVQPGVLMLESLFQAAQFLVRASEGFHSDLVILRESRSIKFASFLQPGDTLYVEAEIIKKADQRFTVKASGKNSGDSLCVGGRLVLECLQNSTSNYGNYTARYMRQLIGQLQQTATDAEIEGYNRADKSIS